MNFAVIESWNIKWCDFNKNPPQSTQSSGYHGNRSSSSATQWAVPECSAVLTCCCVSCCVTPSTKHNLNSDSNQTVCMFSYLPNNMQDFPFITTWEGKKTPRTQTGKVHFWFSFKRIICGSIWQLDSDSTKSASKWGMELQVVKPRDWKSVNLDYYFSSVNEHKASFVCFWSKM